MTPAPSAAGERSPRIESARASGTRRAQFISAVRAALASADHGRAASAALADIRAALRTLDRTRPSR